MAAALRGGSPYKIRRCGKMLKFKKTVSVLVILAMCLAVLAGCAEEKSLAPTNLTYDKTTGEFSFDAVEGVDTYVVGVGKIINDTTGQALTAINQSSTITLPDGSTVYLWSEQTGSVSGLADSDNDGKVTGKVVFREYSSSATTVGAVITDLSKLPVGHYVLQAIPAANEAVPNPEAALYEFVVGGTLETPSGFTAEITSDGCMQITAPSDYYHNCMTVTGLPTKMVFEISEGGTVVETIEMADFSYTNSVNGPNKGFTYNNTSVTGKVKLDSSKTYTVKVTAVGDGGQVKDASAKAYMATSTPAIQFATQHSHEGSGSAGALSVTLTLGVDANGNSIYELSAETNNVIVLRESGTYTASAEIGADGNYAADTVLTFTTDKTDAETAVLNGVSLTAAVDGSTCYFSGKATVDGVEFEFAKPSSGNDSSGGGEPNQGGQQGGGDQGNQGGDQSNQGGDQGGNSGWEISPENITIPENAASFAFTIGGQPFYETTANLQEAPDAGSAYTYILADGDDAAPFDISMVLQLKEDGTAVLTVGSGGPISGGTFSGSWSAEGGSITINW